MSAGAGCKSCAPLVVAVAKPEHSPGCAPVSCEGAAAQPAPRCAQPPPVISARDLAQLRAALSANRAGYTPEWFAAAGEGDAGQALIAILARELEIQGDGLNAMPLRMQLEHLEQLGAQLLPAQSARAPLVFKLLDSATGDATVPAGTRVAAVLPPPAPSLDGSAATARAAKPEFFTEQEITAMRGKVAALYSIDPQDDVYADHTATRASGFTLFTDMQPVPHRIYLGHGELYKLAGIAQVDVSIDFATPGTNTAGVAAGQRPLLFDWEYLSNDGWLPLTLVSDRTDRFTRDGTVTLGKFCGPDSKEDVVGGHSSYWIRATVASRVPAARIAKDPLAGGLTVEVERVRELLPGDVVTVDGVSRATVKGTTDREVILDAMPAQVRAGEYLMLADALPPLRPDGADEAGTLPRVDVIRTRVGFSRTDLALDGAYLDGFKVDTSKDFHPFGRQPERFASFYIACRDAFSRTAARVDLELTFIDTGTAVASPKVEVEYYNGTRWMGLGPDQQYKNGTQGLTVTPMTPGGDMLPAIVSFLVPPDWVESNINAEQNFWLRFRLASGDFGQPLSISVEPDPADNTKFIVKSAASTLVPPVLAQLRVNYLVFSNPKPLDYCVTENDFALAEHSEDARWPRSPFVPFVPVSDRTPALHLGFDARPPAALVSLLATVAAPAEDAAAQPFVWEYWGSRGWTELSVRDYTAGFSRTGLMQFVGAPDAQPRDGLGGALYRVRARLKPGFSSQDYQVRAGGLWLNAAWAVEGTRYVNDMLGISNGNPDQTFALASVRGNPGGLTGNATSLAANDVGEFNRALNLPVTGVPLLAGEEVWVREWTGRGDDWETTAMGVPAQDYRLDADPREPTVKTALWIRWKAQPHLYASGPADRHYVVERARGVFRFPGTDGFIPPAGCPIVANYVTGGGVAGNVAAGLIRELHSGVGFVESVTNPLASSGGAAPERLREARDRSAQAVRHRDRAVSIEDYEWIAREASAEVARARALPLESPAGRGGRGYAGIVIVPQSNDAMPKPSRELSARVQAHLAARVPAGTAGGVRILAPSYVPVGVRAEIIPCVAEDAGRVEARVRARLAQFLHPLHGGRDGFGWEFGAPAYLSDIAALLEGTEGVDAVRFLQLMAGQAVHGDHVPVGPGDLVAAGDSQLKLIVPSVPYALA